MSTVTLPNPAFQVVHRKVKRLRLLLRCYVVLEGLAAIAITVGLAFWLGMLIDWVFEPTPAVRVLFEILVVLATLYVANRTLFSRLFRRLPDSSMALLLERCYPDFRQGLLTTVQIAAQEPRFSPETAELIEHTTSTVVNTLHDVKLGPIFRLRPLVWKCCAAVVLVGAIGLLAITHPAVYGCWLERIQLSRELWPRQASLSVVGFFESSGNRVVNVARDDDFELEVFASLKNDHVAPEQVEIRYRLSDGRRGRDVMTKVGEAVAGKDDAQQFRYVFKNVSSNLSFDVIGDDDRINDLRIRVVERPQIVRTTLDCEFPEYLQWAPQSIPFSGRAEIPEGTDVVCRVEANKDLQQVRIHESSSRRDISVTLSGDSPREFQFSLASAAEDQVLLVTMQDSDGVENREPYRLMISVVPDEIPDVNVRLYGIGSAVTPQAIIPFSGQITDDHGLELTWIEGQVDQSEPIRREFVVEGLRKGDYGELTRFDLAESDSTAQQRLVDLQPGEQITLSIKAQDAYNLADQPQIGSSQRFVLDVVTDSDLRAILEKRELSLRQRFEAIYDKMLGTRDLLNRVNVQSAEEGQGTESTTGQADLLERDRLRVSGSIQNATQMSYETLGIAEGFEEIVVELQNNRIDTEELTARLQRDIAEPLRTVASELLPELEKRLTRLELELSNSGPDGAVLTEVVVQADLVVEAMKQVLDRMLELESYNELVDLLRSIIREQQKLNEETKRQRRARLRQLLGDE